MILHLHPWQCQSGAAHRVYFDTPPLKGSRRYTNVNLLELKEIR